MGKRRTPPKSTKKTVYRDPRGRFSSKADAAYWKAESAEVRVIHTPREHREHAQKRTPSRWDAGIVPLAFRGSFGGKVPTEPDTRLSKQRNARRERLLEQGILPKPDIWEKTQTQKGDKVQTAYYRYEGHDGERVIDLHLQNLTTKPPDEKATPKRGTVVRVSVGTGYKGNSVWLGSTYGNPYDAIGFLGRWREGRHSGEAIIAVAKDEDIPIWYELEVRAYGHDASDVFGARALREESARPPLPTPPQPTVPNDNPMRGVQRKRASRLSKPKVRGKGKRKQSRKTVRSTKSTQSRVRLRGKPRGKASKGKRK